MDLRQLKIFCAVVDHGSFTAAAEAVHTVQSNVTMRVKELEAELGQPLFIRQKSGVVLTSAGITFLGYARRILQLTEESRAALAETGTPAGPLRLGAMETTAAIRLPRLLGAWADLSNDLLDSLIDFTVVHNRVIPDLGDCVDVPEGGYQFGIRMT